MPRQRCPNVAATSQIGRECHDPQGHRVTAVFHPSNLPCVVDHISQHGSSEAKNCSSINWLLNFEILKNVIPRHFPGMLCKYKGFHRTSVSKHANSIYVQVFLANTESITPNTKNTTQYHPSKRQILLSCEGKWIFPKIGVPQNGWFIMENSIKMDDLGGKPTIFGFPL